MSKMNLSVFLSTYSDRRASNSPNLSNFKWAREVSGIAVENANSIAATVAASATKVLFTGSAVKRIIYLEASAEITFKVNGGASETLKPIVINDVVFPGILLRTSDITSLEVTNTSSTDEVEIFLASVE